jgi:hypothetical protein
VRWLLPLMLAIALVPNASAAGLPNPCALLTNADAAKVLGSKISYRTPKTDDFYRSCTWNGVDLSSATSAHASLMVDVSRITKAKFLRQAAQWRGAVLVRGLGDVAVGTPRDIAVELSVWQNGLELTFEVVQSSSPAFSAEKAAAKIALEHV